MHYKGPLGGALFALCFIVQSASAFSLISHSVDVDPENQELSFSTLFDQAPDFELDDFGQQAYWFQYFFDIDGEITPDDSGTQQGRSERIFRGSEINQDGDLRIRYTEGDSPDPTSGGWGEIVGSVDFVLDDAELSFIVPWSVLGEDDGIFSFSLLIGESGAAVQTAYGSQSGTTVLVPAALWLQCSPSGRPAAPLFRCYIGV